MYYPESKLFKYKKTPVNLIIKKNFGGFPQ